MQDDLKKPSPLESIPWWVKSIVLVGVTGVFCYKVIQTPISFQFDFPSFLALLLAMFSVGLAAMFYFKATDTSNAFYDNTYKFTHDIAELLVRIESGFGEKLRHLDETYKGMQDRFDQLPSRLQVREAKRELKQEELELEKIVVEKQKLIDELVSKAQLRDEEKEQFLSELNSKEEALQEARHEINFLRRKVGRAEMSRRGIRDPRSTELMNLLSEIVIPRMDPLDIEAAEFSSVKKRFRSVRGLLPRGAINQMKAQNLLDSEGNLTIEGMLLLGELASDRFKEAKPRAMAP